MKVFIVYSTMEGQTRKVTRFMEDIFREEGHEVTIANAKVAQSPEGYDAILIGSSIHIHRYNNPIRKYVHKYADLITNMPNGFFSVCLAVASDLVEEHEEAAGIAEDFYTQTGWKPQMHIQIPGALKYSQYGFLKTFILKRIAKKEGLSTDTSRDHEYTDWNAVRGFAKAFSDKISSAPEPVS